MERKWKLRFQGLGFNVLSAVLSEPETVKPPRMSLRSRNMRLDLYVGLGQETP